jgi:hypothetical protein
VAGLVFGASGELTPPATGRDRWTATVLHTFAGGSDGAVPTSGLVFDATGALYGPTAEGGNGGGCNGGCGTVFKLTPPTARTGGAWREALIYIFMGNNSYGCFTREQDQDKAAEIESWLEQVVETSNTLSMDARTFRHRRAPCISGQTV